MNDRYIYPDQLEIRTLDRPVNATIRVPGSKSITNRALVLAALTDMDVPMTIRGASQCEDTEVMVRCLQTLGFSVEPDWTNNNIVFPFQEGARVPAASADLHVADSGTTMRFLCALVCAGIGRYRIDGSMRMRQRPIQDLLDALNQISGVRARCERDNGFPPVTIESSGLRGGRVSIKADVSSQFTSAILLVAAFSEVDLTVEVQGASVSQPFIDMTVAMLAQWGVHVRQVGVGQYTVASEDIGHNPMTYFVEPDASAASYVWAAAAIVGGRTHVPGVTTDSIQGDAQFTQLLEKMGCEAEIKSSEFVIHGAPLHGITADMNAISDTVPTLAAVACFADSPTTIRNVAHIRHKECDRISALCTELRKLGVEVEEYTDGLNITPRPMHGAEIETYNDHRIAMSMALIGLKVPGVIIKNPGCVAKTYPGYWDDFQKLYG